MERKKGEKAIFNCSADGIPAPNIVWRRNGQLVVDTVNKFNTANTRTDGFRSQAELPGLAGTTSVLTVTNLMTTNSGTYSCRADNGAGLGVTMSTPYTLIVTERKLCQWLTHHEAFST